MLYPAAVSSVMAVLLKHAIQFEGLPKHRFVTARAIVFHQPVDGEGFAVNQLSLIQRFAGEIGSPVITPMLFIEKMILQELISSFGCIQVIAPGIGKAFEVR